MSKEQECIIEYQRVGLDEQRGIELREWKRSRREEYNVRLGGGRSADHCLSINRMQVITPVPLWADRH